MLEPSDMFKNRNEKGDKSEDEFPLKAFAGADVGFNIVLNQNLSDLDFMCKGPVQGYKFKIHSPYVIPRMSSGYQRIQLKTETLVRVQPELSLNSDITGSICHSRSTKSLKYFKEYSHENCISECIASYTLSKCGCVKFSMVHDDNTEICTQHKSKCVSNATIDFLTKSKHSNEFSCDCKPSCETLSYNTKTTQADFDFKGAFKAFQEDIDEEFSKSVMSRLVVYLEEDFYYPTTYTTSHGSLVDFVAKIGGILAFFLGASVISFIEVFFYVVRRLTC